MSHGFSRLLRLIAILGLAAPGCGSVKKAGADGGGGGGDDGGGGGVTHTLTVTADGDGTGTITSTPAGIDCGSECSADFAEGTEVTLSAEAAVGSGFDGWSGDCSGFAPCAITLDADSSVAATFQPGGLVKWASQYGGDLGDVAFRAITDGDGNVIIGGLFSGTINFGGDDLTSTNNANNSPTKDIFVAEFDPDGNHLWSVSYGGTGKDELHGLEVDSAGDVIISGWYQADVTFGDDTVLHQAGDDSFVAKLDGTDGSALWAKGYTGTSVVQTWDLAVNSDDDVVVAFHFKGTASFGGGSEASVGGDDIELAKYKGSDGSHVWSDHYGSTAGDDQVFGLDVDADDNILIFGYFFGTLNLGGSNDLVQTGSNRDMFLARFGTDGKADWSTSYGSTVSIFTAFATVDQDGDFVVGGRFSGTANFGGDDFTSTGDLDIYLAKYSGGDGSHIWSKRYAGAAFKDPRGIGILSNGDVAVAGFFGGDVNFDGMNVSNADRNNLWVARLAAANGDLIWLANFGDEAGAGGGVGRGLAVGPNDAVYMTGTFADSVTFGPGNDFTSKAAGVNDIVLTRLIP